MFQPMNVDKRQDKGEELFCRMPQKFPAKKSISPIYKAAFSYESYTKRFSFGKRNWQKRGDTQCLMIQEFCEKSEIYF